MRRYRFLLAPKWIAFHVLVLAAVVVMINLAFWQLRRLHERQAFNHQVRTHSNEPVAPLGDVLTAGVAPGSVEWRRVSATGTYVPGSELVVVNRSQNGEAGRNLVDPLRLADGSLLLVNRGFVPDADPAAPALPTGTVRLIGQLRASEERRLGQPADASGVRLTEIRRLDIPNVAPQFDASVAPMYLQLLSSAPPQDASLAAIAPPVLDEGPHLSYTVQWSIFSLCAIVGWVLAVRRSIATRDGAKSRPRRGPPPIDDDLARV